MNHGQIEPKLGCSAMVAGGFERFRRALQPSETAWKTVFGGSHSSVPLPSYARRLAGIVPSKGVKIP